MTGLRLDRNGACATTQLTMGGDLLCRLDGLGLTWRHTVPFYQPTRSIHFPLPLDPYYAGMKI